MIFKKGDKLLCVRGRVSFGGQDLIEGNIYTAKADTWLNRDHNLLIDILENGHKDPYFTDRFILYQSPLDILLKALK